MPDKIRKQKEKLRAKRQRNRNLLNSGNWSCDLRKDINYVKKTFLKHRFSIPTRIYLYTFSER